MLTAEPRDERRAVAAAALASCIYLPCIIAAVTHTGQLYSVGKRSTSYIVAVIAVAELLKVAFLSRQQGTHRKGKPPKSRAGDLAKCAGMCICTAVLFFISIILLGAPALDQHEETAMLATLLTAVTVLPLVRYSGADACLQFLCGARTTDSPGTALLRTATLSVAGAWLGAVVVPLDWDRPWQVWPVPCYLGALAGYVLSNVLTIVIHFLPVWLYQALCLH